MQEGSIPLLTLGFGVLPQSGPKQTCPRGYTDGIPRGTNSIPGILSIPGGTDGFPEGLIVSLGGANAIPGD